MAATLLSEYQAGNDLTFTQRVQAAMLATAQAISTEATSTANHANRVALMKACVNAPQSYAPLFAQLVASQGTDSSSTDTAISTMVSATWNTLAGVV